MLLFALSLLIFPFAASLSADIVAWPIDAATPSTLARISYDPVTRSSQLLDYSPPVDDGALVRVGVALSTGVDLGLRITSLTSSASLASSKDRRPLLRLHLDPSGEVYHVSVSIDSKSNTDNADPRIELVYQEAGPRPQLNPPVVLGPDGKSPEEAAEKTFFQKYWWVLLIVTFLAMSGSAESK